MKKILSKRNLFTLLLIFTFNVSSLFGNYAFKKKVKEAGILHELQQRQFYVKPSAIKRDRRAKGRLRAQIRSKKAEL